jgi:hypothetical protein
MDACTTCLDAGAPKPKKYGVFLFTLAFLVCPCHLPITVGGIVALSAGLITAQMTGLLYAIFSALFVGVLVGVAVYLVRLRERERAYEELHAAHSESA